MHTKATLGFGLTGKGSELSEEESVEAQIRGQFRMKRGCQVKALLHKNREEVPARVRGLVARVADLWLRSTDLEWPFRKEAAAFAVASREGYRRAHHSDRRRPRPFARA